MHEQMLNMAADPAEVWAAALGTGGVFVLLIVVVWQIAATWRARMLTAQDERYKQLAEKYAALLEDNAELHRRNVEQLTEARRAIATLEERAPRDQSDEVR